MKYIDAEKLIAVLERQNVDKKVIQPLIRIIDSLQQEQPEVDLEKAANEYAWEKQEHHIDFDGDEYLDYGPRYDAFKAGAEWQKAKMMKDNPVIIPAEDFQALIDSHAKRVEADYKEKMMEGAVEGEVCGRVYDHINVRHADGVCKYLEPKNISHIPADVSKYNIGDKVKIIIVKEEE